MRFFKHKILIVPFLVLFNCSYCQVLDYKENDTLNQLNEFGKKHGYWLEYVNTKLQACEKEKATFYRYIYYDNGCRVHYARGSTGFLNIDSLKIQGNNIINDSIVLMDGTYSLYTKSNKLLIMEKYKNGFAVESKVFNVRNGKLVELLDYTKLYNNVPHSLYMEGYHRNGILYSKSYLTKNEDGKWKEVFVWIEKK